MAREYNYNQKTSAAKRIKKAHKKIGFIGILYFIGTIAVAALSLLGCLKIEYAKDGATFSVLNFYKAFFWIFKADYSGVFTSVTYLIMTLVSVSSIFRAFSKIRKVLKKNEKNIHACNRNLSAMEEIGELFSMTLSTALICHMLMYAFTPASGDLFIERSGNPLTLIGMIFCAVGVLIHFIAGGLAATSSIFIVRISVEEKKREDGVFLYVLRSLIKVVSVCAIAAMFLPRCIIHECLPSLLKFDFGGLADNLIVFALQVVALIFLCVCAKKAFSTLEFNLFGMDAYGMRKFSVFVLILAILNIGLFVLTMGNMKEDPKTIAYILNAVVGIFAFAFDFIIKPKDSLEKQIEEPLQPVQPPKEATQEKPQIPVRMGPAYPSSIDLRLVMPEESERDMEVSEAPTKWQVVCPTCGKTLAVKDAPFHRCPACGKVFKINVGKIANASAEAASLEEFSAGKIKETPSESGTGKNAKKAKKVKQAKEKPVKIKKPKGKKSTQEILAEIEAK